MNELVRAKKIIFDSENNYMVFQGATLRPSRHGGYKETGETAVYAGCFHSICVNDVFEITYEVKKTKFHGERREVTAYRRVLPGTLEEVKAFLMSRKKGLGPKRIEQLIEKYGLGVLDAIQNDPKVFDGLGIPAAAAKALKNEIVADGVFEEILTELRLNNLDFRFATPLFEKYGNTAVQVIKNSPFAPYMDGIFDFWTADRLHFAAHGNGMDGFRLAMAVFACLRRDRESNGNMFSQKSTLVEQCRQFLSCAKNRFPEHTALTEPELAAALRLLKDREIIILDGSVIAPDTAVYLKNSYEDEINIAQYLKTLAGETKTQNYNRTDIEDFLLRYQAKYKLTLATEQRAAVLMAMLSPVSILTGGPGTGKTQTVNTLLAAIGEISPNATVKLAAPTGKAAQRMSELCNKPAYTIHRMLGIGSFQCATIGARELDCDFLVVDEFSMADAALTARLLYSVDTTTRIVFVGDCDQLPSVGPGLVLRDLVNSGIIPCTRLTQIFRQKKQSRIIHNAHAIITGTQDWLKENLLKCTRPGGDFYFLDSDSPEEIRKIILESHKKLCQNGYSENSIQILSPIHNQTLGIDMLNVWLQARLNPNSPAFTFGDREFRINDKVIHRVNNYTLNVFNGETGKIKAFGLTADETVQVEYPDRDVWYGISDIDQLELAYAISVHKSQGSEYSAIIMPIHDSLMTGLNKNVLYTGITRAKKVVILVGSNRTFAQSITKEDNTARHSNLINRLCSTV